MNFKQLAITAMFAATTGLSAVSMVGFDRSTLTPYIQEAQIAIQTIATQKLESAIRSARLIGKSYAKELYKNQKSALKLIVNRLKDNAAEMKKEQGKAAWLPVRQLYKAFKHDVYKAWKSRVKKQYEQTCKDNEWSWMHEQVLPTA